MLETKLDKLIFLWRGKRKDVGIQKDKKTKQQMEKGKLILITKLV